MKRKVYVALGAIVLIAAAIVVIRAQKAPETPKTAPETVQTASTTQTALPPEKASGGQVTEKAAPPALPVQSSPPQKQATGPQMTKANLIALTNNSRIDAGLKPLKESAELDASADLKINEMVSQHKFAHDLKPNGQLDTTFFTEAGYSERAAAENLGVVYTDVQPPSNVWTAEDLQKVFEQSPEHEVNIVNPLYTEIGVSVANGTYENRPVTFVVVHFGLPQ